MYFFTNTLFFVAFIIITDLAFLKGDTVKLGHMISIMTPFVLTLHVQTKILSVVPWTSYQLYVSVTGEWKGITTQTSPFKVVWVRRCKAII